MKSLLNLCLWLTWSVGVCAPISLVGQADLSGRSEGQLVADLREQMEGSLVVARPVILELIKRFEGKPERAAYLFLAGLSYQDEFAETGQAALLEQAAAYYRQYLEAFPGGSRVDFVRFNLAGTYADLEDYSNAIELYGITYRRTNNAVYRSESRNRMANLYIRSGEAAAGIPLFLEVYSAAVLDPDLRARSASWLIQGYLAAGQPDKIFPYFRYLAGRYEAIYDPSFNIALLQSGDALFEKEEYDQAVLLYSFVKVRSAIIRFYEVRVEELRRRIRYVDPGADQFIVVDGQLRAAEARLAAVKEIRSYDVDLKWRIARVYKETGRTWESLWSFVHLYEDFREHENAEDFLFTAYRESLVLGDETMAEKLAGDYLDEAGFAKFRGQIIPELAGMYADYGRYDDLMELVEGYMAAPRDFAVAAQLLNVVARYYMEDAGYHRIRAFAGELGARFPGEEPLYEATRYWAGLSHLLLADYARASESLASFIDDYTLRSVFYGDAFYRYAVALFGEQRMADAEAQFLRFVEVYPNSSLRGEAELYIGDLKRGRGALAEAAEHYRMASNAAENPAFIGKGVFALSEVLQEMGEPQKAIAELRAYIERYGEAAQLSEAYYRIGIIFDRLGRLDERFKIHALAIKELISDRSNYAIDDLILGYVNDYKRYETTFRDSLNLLRRLAEERAFRKQFLTDRSYQFQFMQGEEGVHVDEALAHRLIRDRAFRKKIIETEPMTDPETGRPRPLGADAVTEAMVLAELLELKNVYAAKAASIAEYDPERIFSELVAAGRASGDLTRRMRAQMALDKLSAEPTPPRFDADELALAPPAVIIWEAAKHREARPEATKELYRIVLDRHPFSRAVFDALLALGEITFEQAEASGAAPDWREALGYYDIITERYAMRSQSAKANLRKGRILSELGRDQEAIDILGQILRNPAWRGLDHAKAHLELGRAYRRQGQLAQAHGFFERLIVAYGGYAETVSWAYYYDLLTLEEMNESESVQQLIEEYKTRSAVLSNTEAYPLIKERYAL